LSLVLIDRDHALGGPAQLYGLPAQGVLTLGALRVLDHLMQGGLAHVEVGVSLQVFRIDLLIVSTHVNISCRVSKIIWAKTPATWPFASGKTKSGGRADSSARKEGASAECRGGEDSSARAEQARIQAATPRWTSALSTFAFGVE
jgi:hypothetical protein